MRDENKGCKLWAMSHLMGALAFPSGNKVSRSKAERLHKFLQTRCQRRAVVLWLSVRSLVADRVEL